MHALRSLPSPVTAQTLADETNVSLRTIYRDIDSLRTLGALIDGEAGFGYTLIEDAQLPPLAFTEDELESLVLGLREVGEIGDAQLANAARSALAKLRARLPPAQSHRLQHAVLSAKRFRKIPESGVDVGALRAACWQEKEIIFTYRDKQGEQTRRQVRPLSIIFMEQAHCLISWCCLRQAFRAFRLDRMTQMVVSDTSFRPNRVPLLRQALETIRKDALSYSKPVSAN